MNKIEHHIYTTYMSKPSYFVRNVDSLLPQVEDAVICRAPPPPPKKKMQPRYPGILVKTVFFHQNMNKIEHHIYMTYMSKPSYFVRNVDSLLPQVKDAVICRATPPPPPPPQKKKKCNPDILVKTMFSIKI